MSNVEWDRCSVNSNRLFEWKEVDETIEGKE